MDNQEKVRSLNRSNKSKYPPMLSNSFYYLTAISMCPMMLPFMIPFGIILFPLIYTILDNLVYILPFVIVIFIIYQLVNLLADADVKESCNNMFNNMRCRCAQFMEEGKKRRECCGRNTCRSMPAGSSYGTVDMTESDDSFEILADLPGVKKEEIKVEVEKNKITVIAERKQEEETKFLVRERSKGIFRKIISLPESADMDTVMAKYEDGVLSIVVSKKEECRTERKNIRID